MKIEEIYQLHSVLKQIGSQATPIRLTVAQNLAITTPIVDSFNKKKQDKFDSLVKIDEDGNPVLNAEIKKAITEGKIKVNQGLPYAAYEFNDEEGIKELNEFIDKEQNVEVEDIEFVGVSLSKKIRLKEDGEKAVDVPLCDLLEATDSKITADAIYLLMQRGILK